MLEGMMVEFIDNIMQDTEKNGERNKAIYTDRPPNTPAQIPPKATNFLLYPLPLLSALGFPAEL